MSGVGEREARGARIGAATGAAGGVALVFLLHAILGRPENFVAKAAAVVVIVGAFGAFAGMLIGRATRDRKA